MHIALVRRRFAATGGAELYLGRLASGLVEVGHRVTLFSAAWEGELPGVEIRAVPEKGNRAERPLSFANQLLKMLDEEKPDTIFTLERTLRQDVYRAGDGLHAAWLQHRKEHTAIPRCWWIGQGAFHRNMLALEQQVFDPANTGQIIVNSEMVRREIQEFTRFPDSHIHLVRNGVDLSRFQLRDRLECRKRWDIPPNAFVVLFVGSGWERKGLWELVRAFERWNCKDALLLVAGKGRILRKARRVRFLGPVREVETLYSSADLSASLPLYEPAANTVTESLACRVPVLTSAQNGASEILSPGISGTVISRSNAIEETLAALQFWMERRTCPIPDSVIPDLSMATNIAATLKVLKV